MIKFKALHSDAVLPSRAHPSDAGLDLTAVSYDINETEGYIEYDTGIACEIPVGCVGLLTARSSITKKDLMLKNSVGVIDSSYRGPIKARFYRTKPGSRNIYARGERIAQLLIVPIKLEDAEFVSELSDTSRSTGGFGSTGK